MGGRKKINHVIETESGPWMAIPKDEIVPLARGEIEKINDTSDLVLLVTDGYDVTVAAPPKLILDKFLEKDCKILFAAEKTCWPDSSLSAQFVNTSGSEYSYLNSGAFIGYADDILRLIKNFKGSNSDDDQRFYIKEYLKDLHSHGSPTSSRTPSGFLLDNKCEIFQCMSYAEEDVQVNTREGNVFNKRTGTSPLVVHGNGPEKTKVFFNTTLFLIIEFLLISTPLEITQFLPIETES